MMVPTGPYLLTDTHATTKMHLEIRNFCKAGGECIFYESLYVLTSHISRHLRLNFETRVIRLFPLIISLLN